MLIRFLFACVLAVTLAGCASLYPRPGPLSYSGSQAMAPQSVSFGKIIALTPITIHYNHQGQEGGGLIGGAMGAGVGAALGGKMGAIIGGLAGIVTGGLAGPDMDTAKGYLITVQSGKTALAFTQPAPPVLRVGEAVEIVAQHNALTRVIPLLPGASS